MHSGSGDGHVQAYVPAGGHEDHGGDNEGGRIGCAYAGQLHREDTGILKTTSLITIPKIHYT